MQNLYTPKIDTKIQDIDGGQEIGERIKIFYRKLNFLLARPDDIFTALNNPSVIPSDAAKLMCVFAMRYDFLHVEGITNFETMRILRSIPAKVSGIIYNHLAGYPLEPTLSSLEYYLSRLKEQGFDIDKYIESVDCGMGVWVDA